jgi:hypothetical protein
MTANRIEGERAVWRDSEGDDGRRGSGGDVKPGGGLRWPMTAVEVGRSQGTDEAPEGTGWGRGRSDYVGKTWAAEAGMEGPDGERAAG